MTSPVPRRGRPEGPLEFRPLDALPPRLSPPPDPTPAGLPVAGAVLLAGVLLVGSPWVVEPLTRWQYDFAAAEGFTGVGSALAVGLLVGLTWPTWDPRPPEPDQVTLWFADNLRTALFVLVTVVLLRRLAAGHPAPSALWRFLAHLAAPVLGVVVATLGAVGVNLALGGEPLREGGLVGSVLGLLSGGLFCGLVYGLLLAWVAVRPPGHPTSVLPGR
jgi:hypothetical protein